MGLEAGGGGGGLGRGVGSGRGGGGGKWNTFPQGTCLFAPVLCVFDVTTRS